MIPAHRVPLENDPSRWGYLEGKKAALYRRQRELLAASGAAPDEVVLYQGGKPVKTGYAPGHSATRVHCLDGRYFAAGDAGDPNDELNDDRFYTVYVDFANAMLGGGWRTNTGFVQEEVAFLECAGLPEAAVYAEKEGMRTRTPLGPTPLLIEGTVRVAEFDLYGRSEAGKVGADEICDRLRPSSRPRTVHWLAMAALRLKKGRPNRTLNNLRDLLDQSLAAFSLAKRAAASDGGRALRLRTGAWGAGAYRQDLEFSIAAQLLAARLARVEEVRVHLYLVGPAGRETVGGAEAAVDAVLGRLGDHAPARKLAMELFNELEAERKSAAPVAAQERDVSGT